MHDDAESRFELTVDQDREPSVIVIRGVIDRMTVPRIFALLEPMFGHEKFLTFDLSEVSSIDSAGVALLAEAMKSGGSGPHACRFQSMSDAVLHSLQQAGWDFRATDLLMQTSQVSALERWGEAAYVGGQSMVYFFHLLSEIAFHGLVAPFKGEKPRYGLFIEQMAKIGANSAPIVLLVAAIVGLTTTFQSAYELRQFGASIYVADLVAISMMTELGPLMAAILVAGRCGAAITAEIGTMRVNEEIDAMTLIGIKPIQYLAVPRIYAVVITQALLGVMSALVGISAGLLIAVVSLDLSITAFALEAISALSLGDLFHNLSKSMVFGIIIVAIGVYYGMRVTGGAEGVGRATTNSVVMSIFLIIVADCVFSLAY